MDTSSREASPATACGAARGPARLGRAAVGASGFSPWARNGLPLVVATAVLSTGCRGQTSSDPPIVPIRNMHQQQRYNPQSESHYFSDHRSQRPLVEGTVARESYIEDDRVALGHEPDSNTYVATIPDEVVAHAHGMENLVARGQDRYRIYCVPCHGGLGDGQGIVPVRAVTTGGYQFPAPPTFHQPRLQHAPDGQLFATITNGVRNMAAYGPQIPVADRWAIVSYVRALQLSQAQQQPSTTPAGATQ